VYAADATPPLLCRRWPPPEASPPTNPLAIRTTTEQVAADEDDGARRSDGCVERGIDTRIARLAALHSIGPTHCSCMPYRACDGRGPDPSVPGARSAELATDHPGIADPGPVRCGSCLAAHDRAGPGCATQPPRCLPLDQHWSAEAYFSVGPSRRVRILNSVPGRGLRRCARIHARSDQVTHRGDETGVRHAALVS
jgi:hypothetical protein